MHLPAGEQESGAWQAELSPHEVAEVNKQADQLFETGDVQVGRGGVGQWDGSECGAITRQNNFLRQAMCWWGGIHWMRGTRM